MRKLITPLTIIILFILSGSVVKAQWANIPATGYNLDVVANGATTSQASTTGDIDGGGFIFIDSTFNPGSGVCETTNVWTSNNLISSLTTAGLTYTLQSASVNNTLQVLSGDSGALTLTTPTAYYYLYVLALGGSGACTFTATVKFSDNSTQVISNLNVADWCSGSSPATDVFYRTKRSTATTCSCGLCQYMYDVNLPISVVNRTKNIASITFTNQNGSGILNILAVAGYLSVPCSAPQHQPTGLTLTPSSYTISGSFTASTGSPGADHYLIVRNTTGTIPSAPVNGTTYSSGTQLSGSTFVAYQAGTTFTDAGLNTTTKYYYYVYAANSTCTGSLPKYLTFTPLTNNMTTLIPPLNGVYTINSGQVTGGTNFNNFTDAVNTLNAIGVSGAVTFNVTTGTYNEQINLLPTTGTSSTNTITFQGVTGDSTKVILQYSDTSAANNYVVQFNGAEFYTIKSMTIQPTNSTYANAVVFSNGANNISVLNNQLIGTQSTPNDLNQYLLRTTDGSSYNSISINNNSFIYGSIGIYFSSANTATNITVKNNYIYNSSFRPALFENIDSLNFGYNKVYIDANHTAGGIFLTGLTGQWKLYDNNITNLGGARVFEGWVNSGTGVGSEALVYNNFMYMGSNSNAVYAFDIGGGYNYVKFLFNTFVGNPSNYNLFINNYYGSNQDITIEDNIFDGTSNLIGISTLPTSPFITDYNDYYTTSTSLGTLAGTTYSTIASWQSATGQESHSISAYPDFTVSGNAQVSNSALIAGIAISGITTDINGQTRTTTPTIGATELSMPPCNTPLSQPTALNLTQGIIGSTITGSFTPSAADHYLIIKSKANSLNAVPINGTTYSTGDTLGKGIVIAYQTGTTFADSGLISDTLYYYYVFAANSSCIGTTKYLTTNPLSDTIRPLYVVFTSSNLPIIVVNTNNVPIYNNVANASYTPGRIGIIYNGLGVRNYMTDPFNNCNDSIGIRVRGSSTRMFPQLSYDVETWDANGNQLNVEVLGMPSENDWDLYAPYDDKSCMRNTLTYALANETGHWAARTQFSELVLNGHYWGIYVWMERIKRNENRVNIAKVDSTDTIGDALTGGYIIKIDKTTGNDCGANDGWNSNYTTDAGSTVTFLYDYPKCEDIVPQQMSYIAAYIDSFETALKAPNFADPVNGYRKYADVNSFIDYFIINEVTNNVDGLRLSTFFYKNRYSLGGKLIMGPVWDYNEGYGNVNYNDANLTTGWCYQTVEAYTGAVPFWWARFMEDTTFTSRLKCRWTQLRQTVLSLTAINNYIDSTANYLNEALARHFIQWPILGVYEWPEPSPIPTTYAGEITNLKTWIQNRLEWLDANMPGGTYNLPVVNLGNDTSACPGQLVLNAGNQGSTYLWNTGDTSQTITVNTGGVYSVTVDENYGCISTDSITVTMKPIPYAFAGNDTSICQGNNVTLNVTGQGSFAYSWNNGVLQGVPFVPLTSQYYTVTVTGINGCTNKDSVLVNVNPLPPQPVITVIWATPDTLISSSPTGNQWYKDGNILLGENGQELLISSYVSGNYTVVVTDANGCSSIPSQIFTITSIKEYNDNCSFVVYPNPSGGLFNLSSNNKPNNCCTVVVYDLMGNAVKQFEWNGENTTFDLSMFTSGVYTMKVNTKDRVEVKKLIIR